MFPKARSKIFTELLRLCSQEPTLNMKIIP
jgi:hypothetical protein